MSRITTCETVAARDVYREQIRSLGARSDSGGPADQGLALMPAGQCDDDPLPGLPVRADVVISAVLIELLVHLAGDPEQCELAECCEISDSEVVAEGGVNLLRCVDIPVGESSTQRLRCHVN